MGAIKYYIVFFVIGTINFSSDQEYETISWSLDRRLSWDDFKGDVPQNARAAAITASGINYRYATSGTKDSLQIDFVIDTFFYPRKSWYQPALADALILSHEQLHFDISELYARKFKRRLAKEKFTYGSVKTRVKLIYKEINKELASYQKLYDKETNYSRDVEKQEEWMVKIGAALEEELD